MYLFSAAPDAAQMPAPRDWTPGDIVPAQVLYCTRGQAVCQVGRRMGRMPLHRCRIARLQDCAEAFSPGMPIRAAVLGLDQREDLLILSGREVLGTWEETVQSFRQGQVVTGTVRTIQPYGIFVELMPNLCGLAEYRHGLSPGDGVLVSIRAILPAKHKIKLDIQKPLSSPPVCKLPEYFITSGHIRRWEYFPGSKAVTVF